MAISERELREMQASLPNGIRWKSADELIAASIEPDPNHPGAGDTRVARYGVHVWALIGYASAVHGDLRRVAEEYDLPLEAVIAAYHYYLRNTSAIDLRLAANAAD